MEKFEEYKSWLMRRLNNFDLDLSPEERKRRQVNFLLSDVLSRGAYNPSNGCSPMYEILDRELRDILSDAERTYALIEDFFSGNFPPEINLRHEEFQKNKELTESLLKIPQEERADLSPHQIFPYICGFEETVKKIYASRGRNLGINLDEISFSTEKIGSGGFSTIYSAKGIDGKKYALKLFEPLELINKGRYPEQRQIRLDIANNIFSGVIPTDSHPFAKLFAFSELNHEGIQSYIREFIPGLCMRDLIEEGKKVSQFDESRILFTYSEMLRSLHSKDKLFVDNNWGGVIFNEREVKICDYDLIRDIKNTSNGSSNFYQHLSSSRENLVGEEITKISDLEQFALMIDEYYNQNSFLYPDTEWIKHRSENDSNAKNNSRYYPQERQEAIPENIRQVVSGLINYPRDMSLTAKDFVYAVKEDYRI